MAAYLLDTNVLIRMVDKGDPENALATKAAATLIGRGHEPVITAQVLIELWAVATRPRSSNGLEWDVPRIVASHRQLQHDFRLLPDTDQIFPTWQSVVSRHQVMGKAVHDARLAAAILAHGLQYILTFNQADFKRYTGLTAVHPRELAVPSP